jgi:hypothetical protein
MDKYLRNDKPQAQEKFLIKKKDNEDIEEEYNKYLKKDVNEDDSLEAEDLNYNEINFIINGNENALNNFNNSNDLNNLNNNKQINQNLDEYQIDEIDDEDLIQTGAPNFNNQNKNLNSNSSKIEKNKFSPMQFNTELLEIN